MNTPRYRDISNNFAANPVTEDVSVYTDTKAISQALKNLILTDHYERPFQPKVGGNIKNLLFENESPILKSRLESAVAEVIENYEPRVTLRNVTATFIPDNNKIDINIEYEITTLDGTFSTNVLLDRIV